MNLAAVVVTEGGNGIVPGFIRRTTDSIWTHAFVVTGEDELVEAWLPRVRTVSLSKRLADLDREGRRYVILDYPFHEPHTRRKVAHKARSYIGRWYDVGEVLHYLWKGRFREDSGSALFCSRLVTASYLSGAKINLFPRGLLDHLEHRGHPRIGNLRDGYATPADLFDSALVPHTPPETRMAA